MNEALGMIPKKENIEKIATNKNVYYEPLKKAEAFNTFFSKIGRNISNSVNPTATVPESYLPDSNSPELEFGNTSPGQIVNIIRLLKSESSTDINGISMKLIKFIAID